MISFTYIAIYTRNIFKYKPILQHEDDTIPTLFSTKKEPSLKQKPSLN